MPKYEFSYEQSRFTDLGPESTGIVRKHTFRARSAQFARRRVKKIIAAEENECFQLRLNRVEKSGKTTHVWLNHPTLGKKLKS